MRWVMYRWRLAGVFEFGFQWDRLQLVLLRSFGAIATPVRVFRASRVATAHRQECLCH